MNKKILKGSFLLFFLLFSCSFLPSPAAGLERPVVVSLEVEGNREVSESRIMTVVRTRANEAFSGETLSDDIRRLMETGLFEEISPRIETRPEGVAITLVVSERPVIDDIRFEGNRLISDRALAREIDLEKGLGYDQSAVVEAREKLLSLYTRRGFREVTVRHERRETAPGRVAVIFHLVEGTVNRVGRVVFEGNQYFSDRKLARLVTTRPRAIHLFRRGTFRADTLREDELKITRLYEEDGFPDASIRSDVNLVGRLLAVTFRIEEGPRLLVGESHFEKPSGDPFSEAELRETAGLPPGRPWSRPALAAAEQNVRALYQGAGYLHARVEALGRHDPLENRVELFWSIDPGELMTVEMVEIAGNTVTRDRVIRREISLLPGDPFDGGKARRSLENIHALRFFRRVDFEPRPGSAPNLTRILFEVEEEERTGSLMFGGGYSSLDGLIGQVMLEQRNFNWRGRPSFRGAGQNFRVESSFGGQRRGFSLSFTEPWVGDRPVSFGIDAYDRRRIWSEFDEHRSGGALRFGWRPEGPWRYSVSPGFERVRISDVSPGASQAYLDEAGKASVHSLSLGVTRDGRDSRIRPRSGTLQSLSLKNTGGLLGGDRDFWKTDYRLTWFRGLPAAFTLSAQTSLGYAQAYGNTDRVPVFERYFVGGSRSVRGYPDRSLGPRDAGGDPSGGNFMFVENLEAVRPLTEALGLAFFADAGYAWDDIPDFRFSDLKVGVGAGLRITVPFLQLPIKLDYAFALDPEPGESRGRVHFDIDLFSF